MKTFRSGSARPLRALTASLLLAVSASSDAMSQPQALGIGLPRLQFQLAGLLSDDVLTPGATDPYSFGVRIHAALPFRSAAADQDAVLDCLTAAIYYEARSEGEAGQRAVAQVVLNRARHPAFPNSICGVVYEGSWRRTGCQFTFTCDGSLRRRRVPWAWAEARRIAAEALAGHVYAPVGYATHYHTNQVRPYWAPSLTRVTSIGAHIFYRWRGAAGEPGSFRMAATAGETPRFALAPPARASRVPEALRREPAVRVHSVGRPIRHVRLAAGAAQAETPQSPAAKPPVPAAGPAAGFSFVETQGPSGPVG